MLGFRPKIILYVMLLGGLGILLLGSSPVSATFCHIREVSYDYPHQAFPGQRIEVDTSVIGSCVNDAGKYYTVRVDLIDRNSGNVLSINSTGITSSAQPNFTVTVINPAITPSTPNATWPLEIHVYVINNGGGTALLIDSSTVGNAAIQIEPAPIPEFSGHSTALMLTSALILAMLVCRISPKRKMAEGNPSTSL